MSNDILLVCSRQQDSHGHCRHTHVFNTGEAKTANLIILGPLGNHPATGESTADKMRIIHDDFIECCPTQHCRMYLEATSHTMMRGGGKICSRMSLARIPGSAFGLRPQLLAKMRSNNVLRRITVSALILITGLIGTIAVPLLQQLTICS